MVMVRHHQSRSAFSMELEVLPVRRLQAQDASLLACVNCGDPRSRVKRKIRILDGYAELFGIVGASPDTSCDWV